MDEHGRDMRDRWMWMITMDEMPYCACPDQVLEAVEAIAAHTGEPVYLRNPQAEAPGRTSGSGV
jgi:hypothetical protein